MKRGTLVLLQLFLGLVLLTAALAKLQDMSGLTTGLAQLGLGRLGVVILASLIPSLEIVIGASLLIRQQSNVGLVGATVLLGIFFCYQIVLLLAPAFQPRPCACFGDLEKNFSQWRGWPALRTGLLASLAGFGLFLRYGAASAGRKILTGPE